MIVTLVPEEIHPEAFCAVTLYVPATKPVKIPVVLVYVEPSILKFNPVVEELTVIVPVATAHVGCKVALAVGAAGELLTVATTDVLLPVVQPDAVAST